MPVTTLRARHHAAMPFFLHSLSQRRIAEERAR